MKKEVRVERRIIFADTDAGGMMYFGQASRWIETAIHEWFRENKFSFLDKPELNLFWVIREVRTLYSEPIAYDELITISCSIEKIQRYSLAFQIAVTGNQGKTKFTSHARLVATDKQTQESIQVPDQLYSQKGSL